MSLTLQIFLILGALGFTATIFYGLVQKKLLLKYTLLWLLAALVILLIAIFPNAVLRFGEVLGIVTPANAVFLFVGIFSLLILFAITIILSSNSEKICKLTQSNALLEKRIRELESTLENKSESENAR